jgi:hypothetical protein
MGTLGAVTIHVFAVVVVPLDGIPENLAGILDLFTDFRQKGQLQWGSILLYEIIYVYIIEMKTVIF